MCTLPFMHAINIFFIIYNVIVKHCPVQQTCNGSTSQTVFFITLVILGTQNQKQSVSRVDIQPCFTLHSVMCFILLVHGLDFSETGTL
uniref:Uncharacterized protein n=1 Tax=Rhipicephalus zambeziensis TaxID=60191 RepID=A0A224YE77_9ACAR